MTINDNFFSGGSAAGNGYGATISINMGTACLEFIGNSATPVNSPVPYVFTGTGGTFNRTAGSDESTNTGTFMLTNVNPAGSCSQ